MESPKVASEREDVLFLKEKIDEILNKWHALPDSRIEGDDYKNQTVTEAKRFNKFRKNWFQLVVGYAQHIADMVPNKAEGAKLRDQALALREEISKSKDVNEESVKRGDELLLRCREILETL